MARWEFNKPFKEILDTISFSALISFYHPYREAPEEKVIEKIRSLFPAGSSLKRWRRLRGLSQSQLPLLSGVKLRSIQCYEQGNIDIQSAQAKMVYALAEISDCSVENLLA
ncbi:MAG: helix-turn-helix domain-containing protein [Candidatus Enteromonas sp.]